MIQINLQNELVKFFEFAIDHLESDEAIGSIDELFQKWRQNIEFIETLADVRQGIEDERTGNAESIADAFADIRKRLGAMR